MADEDRFLPTEAWLVEADDDDLRKDLRASIEWANSQNSVVQSVNSKIARAAFVRDILYERSISRSSKRMEQLTWVITALTLLNVVLVAVSIAR